MPATSPQRSRAAAFAILAAGVGISVPVLSLVEGGLLGAGGYANPPEILEVERLGGLTGWSGSLLTPARLQGDNLRILLATLLVFGLLVLAIACANLVILLLARANARRHEVAVRAALGGAPRRLARQLLAEGVSLGGLGGGLGLALGLGGIGLLRATWPEGLPLWLGMLPSPRSGLVGLGIPLAAVVLSTLTPCVVAWRRDLRSILVAGRQATATPGEAYFRDLCVICGVALTALLLTSAGLLFRATAPDISRGDAGMNAEEVLTFVVDLPAVGGAAPALSADPEVRVDHAVRADPAAEGADPAARLTSYEMLLTEVGRLPGVRSESIASPGTWVGLGVHDRVNVVCGRCSRAGAYTPLLAETARHHVVGPSYFDTVGVAVVSGREFTAADRIDAPLVAIVNEAFRTSFERGEPIGKKVQIGGPRGEWHIIVGVVRDTQPRGIGAGTEPVPTVYLSAFQYPPERAGVAVRVAGGDPLRLAARVEDKIRGAVPGAVLSDAAPLGEVLVRFLAPLRWVSELFIFLAGLALVLAAGALSGVISYSVRLRTREIGVRMALGAESREVSGMVLRHGTRLTLRGAAFGCIGTIGVARLLQQLFHGVRVFDAPLYMGVVSLLACVALVASWRPARRAAAVDPLVALRME